MATLLSGGAGAAAATRKRREEQKPASLADALGDFLQNYMMNQRVETESETKRQKTEKSTDYWGSEWNWHTQGHQNEEAQLAKKLLVMLKQCLNQGLPDIQVAEKVLQVIQPFITTRIRDMKRPIEAKLIGTPNNPNPNPFIRVPCTVGTRFKNLKRIKPLFPKKS